MKGLTKAEQMDWTERGACISIPFTALDLLFFNPRPNNLLTKKAVAICHTCSVLKECKAWTLAADAESTKRSDIRGVRGGLEERERAQIARIYQEQPTCKGCGFRLRYKNLPADMFPGTLAASDKTCTTCWRCERGKKEVC